ncbi:hypothetical protein N5W20_08805 [Candidatus Kirkpatrickella diaphorinae]|uniref:Uncharacterized protein n=1 Tax=Candidatus Kirkpatrickella diaphorinae TaxID=2984322 RepID=A0ABY6GK30_9PROT|nr:hypothetical protein [Candidatus Kirkpatrickella diaphorinae]UYH51173.1 hypothetical protein N5W20_08805 [Candidatus Kirkpatrickella diaphorinae]
MPKRQRAETTPDSGVPLVWSGLGYKTEALIKLVRIAPPGTRVVVDANRLNWMRRFARHLTLYVQNGDEIEEISRHGARKPGQVLQTHCLPSQIRADGMPVAVALDIIMNPDPAAAWQEVDYLVAEGLSSQIAATALVGTPIDIAERIFDYVTAGVRTVILMPPVDRAPFYAVSAHLEPLLKEGRRRAERNPMAPVQEDTIAWNDAAL